MLKEDVRLDRPSLKEALLKTEQIAVPTIARASCSTYYALGLMTCAMALSMIDRTVLSLLIGPIQRDLRVSDTEFSILHGFTFVGLYSLLGVPCGQLADRISRRRMMAFGIAAWSLMTGCFGLAERYWQLVLSRVGVGVGEAALTPAALSLLAGMFPKDRLGRAIAIYTSGAHIGTALSFLLGGVFLAATARNPTLTLPILGIVKSWQLIFVFLAIPGFALALLMLTIREPLRTTRPGGTASMLEALQFLNANRAAILHHFLGFALVLLVMYAFMSWAPALLFRRHQIDASHVGVIFAIGFSVFGPAGLFTGGWLTDRMVRRGSHDGYLRVAAWGMVSLLPFALAAPLVHDWRLAVGLLYGVIFFSSIPNAGGIAGLQRITPPHLRGRVVAMFYLVINLLGYGFGPLLVALATDFVFKDKAALGWSLALVSATVVPLSALTFATGQKIFARSVQRVLAADSAISVL